MKRAAINVDVQITFVVPKKYGNIGNIMAYNHHNNHLR